MKTVLKLKRADATLCRRLGELVTIGYYKNANEALADVGVQHLPQEYRDVLYDKIMDTVCCR
jgi:hypothetical protein